MIGTTTESPGVALARLGLSLPSTPTAIASYLPALRSGSHVYTAGQLPTVGGMLNIVGRVGDGPDAVAADVAAEQARIAVLNALSAIVGVVGTLDAIKRIVKVTVFVASEPSFTAQSRVANGASDLLADIFGEKGRHVRSAVGVAALPLGAVVEVELIVEVA